MAASQSKPFFRFKTFFILFLLILIGAGTFFFMKAQTAGELPWQNTVKGDRIKVKRGPIIESIYGIGTVTSKQIFHLKVGVASSMKQAFVKQGSVVQKGDPLISLSETGIVKAPFAGTVTQFPFEAGENVFPQVSILTLEDLDHLYLQVSLEQQGALRVKRGQKVRLAFESLRAQRFVGQVQSIFPENGQFFVNIDCDAFPEGVLPGMTADTAIEISQQQSATLVPLAAIKAGKLWLDRDGQISQIDIKVGLTDGEWAEVISPPLKDSDQIIIRKE